MGSHKLSERQKCNRRNICMSLFGRHGKKSFRWMIITSDEKWISYDNPVRKRQWVYSRTPSINILKPDIRIKKILLSICWDKLLESW